MKSRGRVLLGPVGALLVVAALVVSGCGSSSKHSTSPSAGGTGSTASAGNAASAPGVTPSTIKIGFITSVTGAASSTFQTSELGARAYFTAVNKAGGVDGRQIQLVSVDDTSTPPGAVTATQLLMSQNVFGIISDSPYFNAAYKLPQAAGIPVTGVSFDGPEWGEQPNTNMFNASGGVDPNHPELQAALTSVAFFKYLGLKNIAGLAYGDSPSSTSSIKDMKTEAQNQGLKTGYENLSLAFGTTDTSTAVLAMKNAGIDMSVCSCVQSTVLAMVTGLKQSGSSSSSLSFAAADSTLFSSPTATQAAQGLYYTSQIPPLDTNNSASTTFENNIKAVDPSYQPGTYPSTGVVYAYLGAALMVKGLQVAGQNPTRQSFISNLTQVTGWNANGLEPASVSFNHFGTAEKTYCEYYVHVSGQRFVSVNGGKSFCVNVPPNL